MAHTWPRQGARHQIEPTVRIRARGKISAWASTGVLGRMRSTMARTGARIVPLHSSTGASPDAEAWSKAVRSFCMKSPSLLGAMASWRSSGGPTMLSAKACSQSGERVISGM